MKRIKKLAKCGKPELHFTDERTMLKAIDHKTWPVLSKLDDIMPRSTANGRFAHDGANKGKGGGHSGGESDFESASGRIADQGPFIPLFPPSIIAPFIALSKTGPATASAVAATSAPSLFSTSSSTVLQVPSLTAPPPSSSSVPPIQTSVSSFSSSMPAPSSLPSAIVTPVHSQPSVPSLSAQSLPEARSISSGGVSSKGKRKQSAVSDLDDHGSLKHRGP